VDNKHNKELFSSADDWWHNAVVNIMHDNWYAYAQGYKIAADRLIDSLESDRINLDLLIYPIVFMYRQSIELFLKTIIKDGNILLEIQESYPKTHKIDIIWIETRKVLENIWPGSPKSDLEKIEHYIKEFSKHDPSSESFRYPVNRKGKKHLEDLTHINIRNLKDIMDELLSLLGGASAGISYYLDYKSDDFNNTI